MARSTYTDLYNVFNFIPTLRQTKPRVRPEAAICVRKSSARRVLHFTPLITASCVLHRPANRVIHRLQLYLHLFKFNNIERHKRLAQFKICIITVLCRHCRRRSIIKSGGRSHYVSLSLHSPTCTRTSTNTGQRGLDTSNIATG